MRAAVVASMTRRQDRLNPGCGRQEPEGGRRTRRRRQDIYQAERSAEAGPPYNTPSSPGGEFINMPSDDVVSLILSTSGVRKEKRQNSAFTSCLANL
ncbi:hypothetical protein GWI33_005879 [Rhynchophorus ferrugineus]|uniref:Uncharacterized protein n=1 Tax=Rhynchophorus ferrugineus TaxID=354439 RepID=A0A834MFR3_RHYFE|nr:hypothetical protein GWI33_005879 [Rhynchophorus ferrugineus]